MWDRRGFLMLYFGFNRYVGKGDGITISVWNRRKIHKKAGSGFLGCVRIVASAIHRLKDTGCKCVQQHAFKVRPTLPISVQNFLPVTHSLSGKSEGLLFLSWLFLVGNSLRYFSKSFLDQRLDLTKVGHDDCEPVRGQIVVSLMSRDGRGTGSHNAVVDTLGNLSSPDDLPEVVWHYRLNTVKSCSLEYV